MIKKSVIWVCGLILVAALPLSAFADQSIGYQQYFNEGVKAFKEHDDQKALRCFKIAQIYDPSDHELNRYIGILEKRNVILKINEPPSSSGETLGYKYYFNKGIESFQNHDNKKAVHFLNIAIIFDPESKEADRYLENLGQASSVTVSETKQTFKIAASPTAPRNDNTQPQSQRLPSAETQQAAIIPEPSLPEEQVISQSQPLTSTQPQQAAVIPQPPVVIPQEAIYIAAPKAKMPVAEISLMQISNNGQRNPKLQIELNSSVILVGKNIQRFLMVDEGFIRGKIIDADRLGIDAQKIGSTFLHIWDDAGRHTLYVEVIFPKSVTSSTQLVTNGIQHAQPFRVTYSNDWSTYYTGKNIPNLKRQSYDFNQSLAIAGETPYGFFDASGSYSDFNSISQFNTYTVGLSQIPLAGTNDFNLRGFDALRYLSPLTMPGTRLRGVFADVDLMDNLLGVSISHGQEQQTVGFISLGAGQLSDAYIDAVKLTLFPKSDNDRYSFNFATAYGQDRQRYLSNHAYSIEGQHKFNDFLTLSAEEGRDNSHDSTLASLKWQNKGFRTALNFRNIDKNYSTISSMPTYQGETGATWTTSEDFKNFSASTFVEAYRQSFDPNPDNPNALNYDAYGQLRAQVTKNVSSDTDFNFVDNPGELSPRRSIGLNERISRNFGVWNSRQGTVFGGVGYQNSRSSGSNVSDFDREDLIVGVQLPLTNHISSFANYEYDWFDQPHSGGKSNPSIINAGLVYAKQFTPKFSFNSQLEYRDELGVKGNSSFLSGEKSVIITCGMAYNPTPDVSIFADSDVRKSFSHIGNPSFDEFEARLGLRITFGGVTYWDPVGIVSGVVFKDRNGDGHFVLGDEGIPGVKLRVGDKEVITDKQGRFRVKIRAKRVDVVPVLDTIPAGLIFSTPQSLNVEVIQSRNSRADFGLISQTGIYGIVFVDKNGTGVLNDTDQFVGKVKVVLDGKLTQKSDSHGAFYFRKITPGQHIISIDINTLPLNMVPLVKLENKINVAEGVNYMFNIPVKIKKAEGDQN